MIFSGPQLQRRYLLLKRVASHGGFWQSVTGSLELDETHEQAAVREVFEETGIDSREDELIDLGLTNRFAIAPQWLARYAPDVTHNEEVCFALKVSERGVRLDSREHEDYVWESYERAVEMLYWDSSKKAFAVAARLNDSQVRAVRNK